MDPFVRSSVRSFVRSLQSSLPHAWVGLGGGGDQFVGNNINITVSRNDLPYLKNRRSAPPVSCQLMNVINLPLAMDATQDDPRAKRDPVGQGVQKEFRNNSCGPLRDQYYDDCPERDL